MIKICGIIGCYVKDTKNVKKTLRNIFRNQKRRGMQGAGASIYRPAAGKFWRIRRKRPKSVISHKLIAKMQRGDLLLFHHRLPTSTPNTKKCNHPICNEDRRIHLIHNGWLMSPDYHFQRLKKKGHRFETEVRHLSGERIGYGYWNIGGFCDFTDSEAIVHELEENMAGSSMNDSRTVNAMEKSIAAFCGALTFAFVLRGRPKIYLYRGEQPCSVYKDRRGNTWFSSEYPGKTRSGYRLIKHMRKGEIGAIDELSYHSLKMVSSQPSFGSFINGHKWLSSNIGLGATYHSENDSECLKEIVETVYETIIHEQRYWSQYFSVSMIVDMLKDELKDSGVKLSGKGLYKLATDIWEHV